MTTSSPSSAATGGSAAGGLFYGWVVVAASGVILFLTGGTFFYGFGALFNPIVEEYGWTRAVTSVAFSLRAEVGGIAAPIVGVLLDRVGSRLLMIGGVLIVVAGYVWLAHITDLWTFYGATMLIAAGNSAAAGSVGTVAVSRWFVRRRARALAIMFTFSGVSGLIVGPMVWAIGVYGWRPTVIYTGIIIGVLCLPMAMLVRNRPEDYGMLPDGDRLEAGATAAQTMASRRQAAGPSISARQAMKMRAFWLLALALSCSNLGGQAVLVHVLPYFTSISIEPALAAGAVSAMSVVSVVGRLGSGWAADALEKKTVMAAAFGLQTVGILAAASVTSPWMLALFAVVFGIGWGAPIPVRPALQAEYFGLESLGAIQGLLLTVTTVSAMIGPVFAGWIFDVTGSYRPAFVALAAGTALAIPFVLALPSRKRAAAPAA